MTTITVSTAAELENALVKATGGETILLEGGDYGRLDLGKYQAARSLYGSEVTIKSADAADPAVFTGMYLRDVSNVTLDGITFDYTFLDGHASWVRPFRVSGENVTIRNSVFDGDVAEGTGTYADGFGTGFGLSMGGTGMSLENNVFHTWHTAVSTGGEDIRIVGNEFYDMRSDGLNVVGATGVLIEGNHFHDFDRSSASGDHSDMIQFWINKASQVTSDVVIRGNVLDIGEGDATQSILMGNLAVEQGSAGVEAFYRNVLIENNVILNAHLHGISVGPTVGLDILNNTVIQKVNDTVTDPHEEVRHPIIRVNPDSQDVTVADNIANNVRGVLDGWGSGNVLVQNQSLLEPFHYSSIFLSSSLESGELPVVRPDGDAAGAGATLTGAGGTEASPDETSVQPQPVPAPVEQAPVEQAVAEQPAPEPVRTPVFDLDSARPGDMNVLGTVSYESAGGDARLEFAGGAAKVELGDLGQPHLDGSLTATVVYDPDSTSSTQRLLWNHLNFGIEVKNDQVRVYAATEDEGFKSYRVKAPAIKEEGDHRITVAVDSDLDRIQIVVDGEIVFDRIEEGLDLGARGADADRGWQIGTGYGYWFDGTIEGTTIYDEAIFQEWPGEAGDAALLS